MALQTPLDLVSSPGLPSSIRWLALRRMPATPASLAEVLALAIPGFLISPEWGAAQYASPQAVSWRAWQVTVSGPSDPAGYPYEWAGLAVVDTDGPGRLLALFPVAGNNRLAGYGQSVVQTGYILVSVYQPNG